MICDRVAILHRGHLVKTGSKEELTTKGASVELQVEGISDLLLEKLREIALQVQREGNSITLRPREAKTISAIPEIVINHGGKLLSLTTRVESLEDIFYRLIKEEEDSRE
jgi:ABC-2 type transport system ATP-binding protein